MGGKLAPDKVEQQTNADDALESEGRADLEWQRTLVDSLLNYVGAISMAFDAMHQAHAALEAGGIDDVESAAPLARALFNALREASSVIREDVDKHRGPLEMFQAGLLQYAEDVKQADLACFEFQRYTGKVEGLTGAAKAKAEVSKKAQTHLDRNNDKLIGAERSANIAHAKAVDSLSHCKQRRNHLCNLAGHIVSLGSAAFRSVAGSVQATPTSPGASSEYPADNNPFEEEVPCGFSERLAGLCATPGHTSHSTTSSPVAAGAAGNCIEVVDAGRSTGASATASTEGYDNLKDYFAPAAAEPVANPFADEGSSCGSPRFEDDVAAAVAADESNPFADDV